MARQGKEYLKELINAVVCKPNIFRIKIANSDKFIFSISTSDTLTTQWYDMSALYDSICEIDREIKYAFNQVVKYNLSTTLNDYDPFKKLNDKEFEALYHTENIVYRVSVLWDLLAQVCNVVFETRCDVKRINYNKYFEKYSTGENANEFIKKIKTYIDDEEKDEDVNPWPGNHKFLNNYRNDKTHRVSPNITSISSFGFSLRPPIMYVLHRTIEDYYMVSSFLCEIINEFIEKRKDWIPIGMENYEERK
ncbi:MAG: Cthe_2314 family HEPN domain-containing protein [Acutalibacteraceae bacterium]|nr:Cthe_2314 family HEPN domain-containing protein [Acutalibacteraceae bacterium]